MDKYNGTSCLVALIIGAIAPWVAVYALILTYYPNRGNHIKIFWTGWGAFALLILLLSAFDYLHNRRFYKQGK
jgi:hypothetical protein